MNEELIRNEIVIDWKHIFLSVVKKWWVILLCLILGAAAGLGLGIKVDKPLYECQAVYVLSYSGGDSVNQMASEYSFLTRILYNCTEVLKQNSFTNKVADEINEGISEDSEAYIPTEDLEKCISYTYATQGTIIRVAVDTGDPTLSYSIINSIINNLQDHIKSEYKLAGIDSMVFSLVNTPVMPEKPVESNTRVVFTLVGAAAFAFICLAIIVLVAFADNKVKKEEDLTNRFNIPVLGTIPNFFDSDLYKGGYYRYGSQK